MTASRRVAAQLGSTLADLHGGPVFGLAGSGNFELLAEFVARDGRYVGTRHEAGAVMMADGWAQVSGATGVASVHQGPGFTNALTAIVDAVKGRTPLVVLAADTARHDRSSHQFVDQKAMLDAAGIGAEVVVLDDPATAAAGLVASFARAAAERACIVVMLPVDVLNSPAPASDPAVLASSAYPAQPSADDLTAIVDALDGSRRPAVLAGRGAVAAGAGPAIAALAEALGAPLITTAPARGLFAGHRLAAGFAGGFASRVTTDLLQEADTVLAFGTSLDNWTLVGGATLAPDALVVRIDLGAEPRPGVVEVRADARATADALVPQVAARRSVDQLAARIAPDDRPTTIPAHDGAAGADPRAVLARLGALLPADRVVAIDSGHFMAFAAIYLDVARGGDYLFGQAFQSVGLGLARATGAALARPAGTTLAVAGDGGFLMGSADLETAVRSGARLIVAVINDEGFGAEVHDFEPIGIDAAIARYPGTDVAAIARGAGATAHVIRSVSDLDAIAPELVAPDGVIVLDCRVDPSVDAITVMTEEGAAEWSTPLHA